MTCLSPVRDAQDGRDDDEGDDTDGQIDVEDPAPAEVLGEQAAEQRAEDAGGAEHRAEQALVAAAFPGRDDVADDRHRQHHEAAAAQSLDRPEGDQLGHVLSQSAQRRTDQEDDDRGLEQALPAVLVAQFAPQRGGGGRREQVGGDDPAQMVQAAQIADDRGQGRGDDRLVEGGEEHAEQQGADRDEHISGHVLLARIRRRAVRVQGHGCLLGLG